MCNGRGDYIFITTYRREDWLLRCDFLLDRSPYSLLFFFSPPINYICILFVDRVGINGKYYQGLIEIFFLSPSYLAHMAIVR